MEYKVIDRVKPSKLEAELNRLAGAGWRLFELYKFEATYTIVMWKGKDIL